jgi:hypothetical protein
LAALPWLCDLDLRCSVPTPTTRVRPVAGEHGVAPRAPQHPIIVNDEPGTRMAFAAWYGNAGYENGGSRSVWVGILRFNFLGRPALR